MVVFIVIKVVAIPLHIIYFFMKLLPTKNKIAFISRQRNSASLDIKLLNARIKQVLPGYETVILARKLEKSFGKRINYILHMFVQMYHVATSEVVILDSYCIVVSLLKQKKKLTVIQMWHAVGLMKKAGYSILDRAEGKKSNIAKAFKMHNNYKYIFSSSEYCKDAFTKVFGCELDKIVTMPLPRVDCLVDNSYVRKTKKKIYKNYPQLKRKKNIVYAPTFRVEEEEMMEKVNQLISLIDYNKYNLIIKLHTLSKNAIDNENIFINEFSSMENLCISDYVISDYSSIIYEAAILKKPVFLYAFDRTRYLEKRELFIDYDEEIPCVISEDPKEIYKSIENETYDIQGMEQFAIKYVCIDSKTNTYNMAKFIEGCVKGKRQPVRNFRRGIKTDTNGINNVKCSVLNYTLIKRGATIEHISRNNKRTYRL